MNIIDEITSPSGCIWSVYRGPLMIDFAVPLKVEIKEGLAGLTRAEDVHVEGELDLDEGEPLEVLPPDDCETSFEMRQAILREAFPALARVVYDDDEPTAEAVRNAAARDIEAQARAVEGTGIMLGDDSELLRTQRRCFHRIGPGSFQEVDVNDANDFCCGLTAMKPDEQDKVHLVFIAVAYRRNRPVSARLTVGLGLRVDAHGLVVKAHRADAYQREEFNLEPLHERRNEAVRWKPAGKDWATLERMIGCDIQSASIPQ